jgi:hypothetical protein
MSAGVPMRPTFILVIRQQHRAVVLNLTPLTAGPMHTLMVKPLTISGVLLGTSHYRDGARNQLSAKNDSDIGPAFSRSEPSFDSASCDNLHAALRMEMSGGW